MSPLSIEGIHGVIGLAACPGRGRPGGPGAGPLEELREFHAWGAQWLITLMEAPELSWFGLEDLPKMCDDAGLRWLHAPIADFTAPDIAFEAQWAEHGEHIRAHLADGGRIVLHCLAGLGRTGTVAGRILVELGYAPADAVEAVRRARPGSIQSEDQLDYLLRRRWQEPAGPLPASGAPGNRGRSP